MHAITGRTMKRVLEITAAGGQWTTPQLARKSGSSAASCLNVVTRLVGYGYLDKIGEARNPRGGKPLGVYGWTGKQPAARVTRDVSVLSQCMQAMVSTGRVQ